MSDDAMEALYPFLYSGSSDLSAVLDQVRASTVAKAGEILELRREVAARDGDRLAECARQVAARFGAGERPVSVVQNRLGVRAFRPVRAAGTWLRREPPRDPGQREHRGNRVRSYGENRRGTLDNANFKAEEWDDAVRRRIP